MFHLLWFWSGPTSYFTTQGTKARNICLKIQALAATTVTPPSHPKVIGTLSLFTALLLRLYVRLFESISCHLLRWTLPCSGEHEDAPGMGSLVLGGLYAAQNAADIEDDDIRRPEFEELRRQREEDAKKVVRAESCLCSYRYCYSNFASHLTQTMGMFDEVYLRKVEKLQNEVKCRNSCGNQFCSKVLHHFTCLLMTFGTNEPSMSKTISRLL